MPSSSPLDSTDLDQWLKSVLDSTTHLAVIVVSLDGQILAWLGASAVLFGYSSEEAVGQSVGILFTAEDRAQRLDVQERELALSAGHSEDDRWHLRKDGSRLWASGLMEQIHDADGKVVALVKTVRDRTDLRTQVKVLENRLAEAEHQGAARVRALAVIAHELRNQAAPFVNLVDALERTPDTGRVINSMRRQMKVLARLLDDLAESAAVVADGTRLRLETVALQAALEDAASVMRPHIEQRGQQLKVTVPQTPILFEADPHRVNQMLVNLLSNASKFTPSGGTIQISGTVEEDMVVMRVEDDGEGIPPEVLPRLFELFTRGERTAAIPGLGIGLSVVKRLAELHGGFVEGRSVGRGKGSTFTVRLPRGQVQSSTGSEP
ncbi:MAG: ATP-binding protein [Vitreoscilla sp.]